MDRVKIIENIKSSFCNLTSFKERDNSLEVITPYSTLNNKFVSVFVTISRDKIVVTDNGWIDQNYYETPLNDELEDIFRRVKSSYLSSFNVKTTLDKSGVEFFYKVCKSITEIPSAVFDLASFTVGIINSFCVQYKDEKEEKERETFRQDANDFLKSQYLDNVKLRISLDDFKGIKFNAVVNKHSNLFLLTYVTGSTQTYFENDLRKSIVNFELAVKSKYKEFIKERISIVNDKSDGYLPEKSSYIFELLNEKTTREPIKWSEKERLTEFI